MTKENRKKLFISDPERFAAYGAEFKDELAKAKPKLKKPKLKKPKGGK